MGLLYQRKNHEADEKGKTAQFTDFLHLLSNKEGDNAGAQNKTEDNENNDNKKE